MTDMERKSIRMELKADSEGSFTARIATLNVVDSDGDLTVPGAFKANTPVLVSAYQHGSWSGALPVGRAVLNEKGDEVIAEGQFNLNMTLGREHYEAVKFTDELQEWSYGFMVTKVANDEELDSWAREHDGARPQRIIKSVDPFEISPVLKGAGVGTATLGIKSGMPYAEHMDAVLAAVDSATDRTKSLAGLRRKEGRDLSAANRKRIEELVHSLSEVKAELETVLVEPEDHAKEIDALFLEYAQIQLELSEV